MNTVQKTIKGRPYGWVSSLAKRLNLKSPQQVYYWAKKGEVPAKYAVAFARITGEKLEDICPSIVL